MPALLSSVISSASLDITSRPRYMGREFRRNSDAATPFFRARGMPPL